jgi:hypothetical protein
MLRTIASEFREEKHHSDEDGESPYGERQSKHEARNRALHAAVVKFAPGWGEALADLPHASRQQPVAPPDGQEADRGQQDAGGHVLFRGGGSSSCPAGLPRVQPFALLGDLAVSFEWGEQTVEILRFDPHLRRQFGDRDAWLGFDK